MGAAQARAQARSGSLMSAVVSTGTLRPLWEPCERRCERRGGTRRGEAARGDGWGGALGSVVWPAWRADVLTEIEDGCEEWASRLHGSSYLEKLRWTGGTIGPAPPRGAARVGTRRRERSDSEPRYSWPGRSACTRPPGSRRRPRNRVFRSW